MISRHRGDLRAHSRWRPSTPAGFLPASIATEDEDLPSRQPDEVPGELHDPDLPRATRRTPRALIAVATILAIAVIAGQQHSGTAPAAPRLPSSPQQ